MLSMPKAPRLHARRSHLPLLASCALAAVLAVPTAARAQAFQGTPTTAAGSVGYDRGTPGRDTITIGSSSAIIDWTPSDSATGGGTIDFLPAGTTANYTGRTDYTVLNRILPADPSRPVGLNGTINSTVGAARGGTLWFYSPGGIVVGSSATFNIGSLLLTADNIIGAPGDKTVQFRGDADSRASVVVQPGARINALNEGSYVALVAPRVSQGGTVTVNGTANYVAAEGADITIAGNLFDIRVTTGSYVDPSIPGDGVTLSHSGTTTGPASTGPGDPHLAMMVAVPKNDAVTMLVGGTIGFEAASSASIENGVVVLSAGSDIRTFFDGNGHFQVGVDFNFGLGQTADLTLTGGRFTSRVLGVATNDIAASGNLDFSHKLELDAGQDIRLAAASGSLIHVGGDLALRSFGVNADAAAVPATIAIRADGGTIRLDGNATLDASGLDAGLGSVTGGTVRIEGNGGTIATGGDLTLRADALTRYDAATGGSAQIALTGGSLTVGGKLALSAEANGSTATGGDISILAGDAAVTIGQSLTASARAVATAEVNSLGLIAGGWGDAQGGSISIRTTGGGGASLSAAGTTLDASARGADGVGGSDGGNAAGGSISIAAEGGSLSLGGLSADASGRGGRGSDGWSSGYRGGSGSGGTIDVYADGGMLTIGDLSFDVSGLGGDGGDAFETGYGTPAGGDGGLGLGGQASFRAAAGGTASASTLSIHAGGVGGNGGTGDDGRGDGAAAAGRGGSITVSATGGTITLSGDTAELLATGRSGSGAVFAGEGGAEGRGGIILVSAVDGAIGGTGGGFALTADASGFGGISTRPNGTGAAGSGGTIRIEADRGEGRGPGRIDTAALTLVADGEGGAAIGRPDISTDTLLAAPAGGRGTGGEITLDAAAGTIGSGPVAISARGTGGAPGSGGSGGTGQGGTVQLGAGGSGSGTILLGDVTIDAQGFGGGPSTTGQSDADGGQGIGGSITLSVTQGSIAASGFEADASGFGGNAFEMGYGAPPGVDAGRGGDGRGGTISVMLAASGEGGNSLALGAVAKLRAAGIGGGGGKGSRTGFGGAGGNGFGGSIGFVDADPLALSFDVDGIGGAGGSGSAGGAGGSGTGGGITLTSYGGTLTIDALQLSARGIGGAGGSGLAGDGGAGGSATGGLIDLAASGEGALTVNALTASAAASGGQGGSSTAGGQGGAGGDASGGSIGLAAEGGARFTMNGVSQVAATGVGGDGGAGSPGTSGGKGGNGGNAAGGAITLLADGNGRLSLQGAPQSALLLDARATGGKGGRGGDASGIGRPGGDGGTGGQGDGGFLSIRASGGTILAGDASLLVDGAGGQGAAGGSGTGGDDDDDPETPPVPPIDGAAGGSGLGAGGQVVIAVSDDNELGLLGAARLGSIVIGASGDRAGLIEISDRSGDPAGSLDFASLAATANGDPAREGANISVYSEEGPIHVAGAATLTTSGSTQLAFAGTGGLDVGGALAVTTGQRIDITHGGQPAAPVDSIHAGSARFQAGTTFSAGVGSIVRTDGDLSVAALGGAVDAAVLRAGGRITVQGVQDVTIGEAHAGGDITLGSAAGSILVADIASGGLVDALGNAVTLTAPGALRIRSITSRSGDIIVSAAQDLSVASAASARDLRLGGAGLSGGTITAARDAVLTAGADMGFDQIGAGRDISVRAAGDAAITRADAGGNIGIDAGGAVRSTDLTAGGTIQVKAATVTLGSAVTTGTGGIDVASAGDIDFTAVHAGGGVSFSSAHGAVIGGQTEAGGTAAIDAAQGIDIGTLRTGGAIDLISANGAVQVRSDIASGGLVNARGTAVTLNALGDLQVGVVRSTIGDIALAADRLSVNSAQSAGNAFLAAGSGVTIGDAEAAAAITVQSGGTATLAGHVAAGTALDVDAQGLVTIDGTAMGETITIASPDIAIGSDALIGGGATTLLTLLNNAPGTVTTIGGAGGGDGYVLDKGEFTHLHAQNITIRVDTPNTLAGKAAVPLAAGTPDIRIEDLDVVGSDGVNANITSATGALTIETDGNLRVAGDVRFTSAAAENTLALTAGGLLDIITPDGSVTMTGKDGALSGRLQLSGDSIFVGTLQAEQDIAGLSDTEARNGRLGENDGLDNAAGYVQAGALEFAPFESLYIQNSGQNGTTPATRGGFTARSVTITTPADGRQTDIVLNGRILNGDGSFTTGKAIIPLLRIQKAGTDQPGSYTPGSKVNNCLIAGGDCVDEVREGPRLPPDQDIIAIVDQETPIGTLTPYLDQAAIQFIDLDPYSVMPDIDDPVTGAGNDDLWSAACPLDRPGSDCKAR